MGSILIKNGFVIDVINKENSGNKDIYINNDKIEQIGLNINKEADRIINAEGNIVMPGLINTHNHSAMTLFRGYADDSELMDWLNNKIWPAEDKLSYEDVYYGSLLACVEMIKSGTTMFNDMYFFSEATAKAALKTNIRAMLGRCIMAIENEDDVRVKEAIELIEKYNKEDSLILPCVAPHAPYTCNKEAIIKSVNIAKKYNVPLHIHLAETRQEVDIIKERYNMKPAKFLESLGVFSTKAILAHGVWLEDDELDIIKKYGAGISHNPVSNCKLASGIANVSKYMKMGINVALGTDGAGSTNTLDMFEEMRLCNLLQKVNNLSSNVIDAFTAIQMATINGAKILGVEEKVGSIEVGKKADVIIVDGKNIKFNPVNDIYSNLVYVATGNDVITSIINGNIVMENRRVNGVDEEDIVEKCKIITKRLFEN